ncbi:hypothetical protein CORC01_00851 [Colletotrichum orchidophilum]|uniref:Uncharacterized protein n=1 Tax=Colletotrichum orchidophilum TaxID=1209926 RepID=A0A1G4BRA7_9PEZI|nr:uncharacterized protein CORC01_00851 [Colletotrichum orchidophilum]OHF03989.1 hypothetical protein CORC01_00851 [Colletotrichum orchidophilum]
MVQLSSVALLLSFIASHLVSIQAQSLPKQLAVVRRRSGLTHKEYLYYHTLVHGQKSWNAPRDDAFPAAYVQSHVFDGVFGSNNTVGNQVYVGRDDIAELYSSSPTSFTGPPPTNYTPTVIGPDGANFNDFPVAMSMIATESFLANLPMGPPKPPAKLGNEPPVAFFWAMARKDATSNETFARNLAEALIKPMPAGMVINASIHVPIPGADVRPYFGGESMPILNTVIKLWLSDGDQAITQLRASQTKLDNAALHLDENLSYMLLTKQVTIWDTRAGINFDIPRLEAVLKAENY